MDTYHDNPYYFSVYVLMRPNVFYMPKQQNWEQEITTPELPMALEPEWWLCWTPSPFQTWSPSGPPHENKTFKYFQILMGGFTIQCDSYYLTYYFEYSVSGICGKTNPTTTEDPHLEKPVSSPFHLNKTNTPWWEIWGTPPRCWKVMLPVQCQSVVVFCCQDISTASSKGTLEKGPVQAEKNNGIRRTSVLLETLGPGLNVVPRSSQTLVPLVPSRQVFNMAMPLVCWHHGTRRLLGWSQLMQTMDN